MIRKVLDCKVFSHLNIERRKEEERKPKKKKKKKTGKENLINFFDRWKNNTIER